MVGAYILIECEIESVLDAVDRILEVESVEEASPVTGKFDIIAEVEVGEIDEVREVVADRIHLIDGVKETRTCISA